jgi:hypothetical protein
MMKQFTKWLYLAAALIASWSVSSQALRAAPISYGNFVSPTITFQNVTESTQTPGDPSPLFGAPSLAVIGTNGARLSFLPAGFSSTQNGAGIDVTDGQLQFTMVAANGLSQINSISISESGAYSLIGGPAATANTFARARMLGFVTIKEIAGVPVPDIMIPFQSNPFLVTGPISNVANDGTWSLNHTVNLASLYPNVTRATFSMDNQLITGAEASSYAFIDKKTFTINTDGTFVIPEPSTIVGSVIFLGALMVGFRYRRQIRQELRALLM